MGVFFSELLFYVKGIVSQPVREAVSYRGLFTIGWFGVREKHCSRLKIYDRLRASEQAVYRYRDSCGAWLHHNLRMSWWFSVAPGKCLCGESSSVHIYVRVDCPDPVSLSLQEMFDVRGESLRMYIYHICEYIYMYCLYCVLQNKTKHTLFFSKKIDLLKVK